MDTMDLFGNNVSEKKHLIHYNGELGVFDYDPDEFEIIYNGNNEDCLHYCGTGLSVDLPKGCVNVQRMFAGCKLPKGFHLGEHFNTSEVTDMSHMFEDCEIPTGFELDPNFDTSNVTTMESMFCRCKLPAGFNLGLNFNTKNVKVMRFMFYGSTIPSGFTLGDKFYTTRDTQAAEMFSHCNLPKGFSLGNHFRLRGDWGTHEMFTQCMYDGVDIYKHFKALSVGRVLDELCDVCDNAKATVHYDGVLGSFDYDPNEFHVWRGLDRDVHLGCQKFGGYASIPKGCVVTELLFAGKDFTMELKLGDSLDTSGVIDMNRMFAECKIPKGFTFGEAFDTSSVENMHGMFKECIFYGNLELGKSFNTDKVKDMSSMFESCTFYGDVIWGDAFHTHNVQKL